MGTLREAHVLSDARVRHVARLHPPGSRTGYHWECVCHPDDEHDHDKLHAAINERLVARDQAMDGLQGLVGKHGITDANLQIHGPHKWVLYVAWLEGAKPCQCEQP